MTRTATCPSPLLDLLFDDPAVGRCLVAPDGSVLRANAEWLRACGLELDDVLGEDVLALFPEARRELAPLLARARAGERVQVPAQGASAGAGSSWEGTIEPVALDGGTGLLLSMREVLRPSGAGAAPRDGSPDGMGLLARIRRIADRVPAGVFVKDGVGRYLYVNGWLRRLMGVRRRQVLGHTVGELLPPEIARRQEEHDRRVLAGEEVAAEDAIPTAEGERVLFAVVFPFPLRDGTVGTLGITLDVTEARRVQRELRESEERFRLLANAMPQIVCVLRPDGDAEYVNPSWVAYSGLDLAATRRLGWLGVLHPDDVPAAAECRRRALLERVPQDVELRYRAADGSFRWFLSRLAPVVEGDRVVRFVGAAMDVTDRKQAEEAVRRSELRLQEEARRKDEFLAVLSHELRNPLAPIRAGVQVLRRAEPGSLEATRALETVGRQADHLTRLVDDLLDVTRIARGKIRLHREVLDLRGLVERAVSDHRTEAEAAGVALRLELPDGPSWIEADATRISQAIGNLLGNALKFTPAGGTVTTTLAVPDGRAEVRVRDNGVGMEPALIERLFEPFTQAEEGTGRTRGGLGLGLSVVRGLMEMHGGSVRARSAGKGTGSEFVLSLPLVGGAEGAGRAAPRPAPVHRRVLVVEDGADMRQTLADLLQLDGHVVHVAATGREGIALARELRPDVVLCDIGLPDVDGYEVARTLRRDAALGATRLVALTGYAQPEDRRRAAESGFDLHITKPPSDEDLAAALAPGAP